MPRTTANAGPAVFATRDITKTYRMAEVEVHTLRGVLLCDEPTGALDYATGKVLLQAMAEINRELGTTAAVIIHNAPIGLDRKRAHRRREGDCSSRRYGDP